MAHPARQPTAERHLVPDRPLARVAHGHRRRAVLRRGSRSRWSRPRAGSTTAAPSGRPPRRREARGHRDTVNVVPLDDYLKGVVPQEVPAEWPTDTVRSQAVAARTYAAHESAAAPAGRHFDVCDTTRWQVYGGLTAEQPALQRRRGGHRRGGRDHEGELAFAQFSASNGGWTQGRATSPTCPRRRTSSTRPTATGPRPSRRRRHPALGRPRRPRRRRRRRARRQRQVGARVDRHRNGGERRPSPARRSGRSWA